MEWVTAVNYASWFVFVFIAVVWILVLLDSKESRPSPKVPRKLPMVSILMPAYNEEKTIRETIKSVLDIAYPVRLKEIIVIDDHSGDGTGHVAREFSAHGVKVLTNKKNMGKAWSLNMGIKASRGELIACIDADSLVDKEILMKMVGYFSDPKIASVTPALRVYKASNFWEKIQSAEYLLNIFLRRMLASLDAIHVTPGVFSVYRRTVLEEVGGFDVGNLTEDMEIALKIHSHGYKIENELGAISYTYCPTKVNELFHQRIRWYRGALHNSMKYRNMFFNREYGNLGMFLLPFNFISVIAVITLFMVMVWTYGSTLVTYLWQMSLVNWDFSTFLKGINFNLSMIVPTSVIFGLVGLALGSVLLYMGFVYSNEKVSANMMGYIIYLLVFPLFLMAFWAAALLLEIFRIRRKW